MMTTMTAASNVETAKANRIAAEIASLVAAGKIIIACRSVERVAAMGEAYSLAGQTRIAMDVRGETTTEIFDTLWLVRDAAQALKCKTFTVKKSRDGGKFASQPRFAANGEVMDYFAKIVVILP